MSWITIMLVMVPLGILLWTMAIMALYIAYISIRDRLEEYRYKRSMRKYEKENKNI